MLFVLLLSGLCAGVSSNAIFDFVKVGFMSPDVVYKIGDISSLKTVTEANIKEGLTWFTENTCVNFIDYRDAPEKEITMPIETTADGECRFSDKFEIGDCIGKRYYMVHEIMHHLGFYHTYNRPDWSEYLKILPGMDEYFDRNKCKATPVVSFDYGSGMQHRLERVVEVLVDGYKSTLGQSVRFPFSDAYSINWLFNCSGKCASQPACLNGGYTHPRDCSKCMCNKYYTGNLCETPRQLIKLTCEGNRTHFVKVDNEPDESLGEPVLADDFRNPRDDLWQIIEAPESTKIEVEVTSASNYNTASAACGSFAAEVNDGDFNLVGRMFCDNDEKTVNKFTAKSNKIGFHAEYTNERQIRITAKFTLSGCDGSVPPTTTTTTSPLTTTSTTTQTTTVTSITSTTSPPSTQTTTTAPPSITTTTKPTEEFVCEY